MSNRCSDLNIIEVYQGVSEKLEKVKEILAKYNENNNSMYSLKNVAYIGDDLVDFKCILYINQEGGITATPSDGVTKLAECVRYVCNKCGGQGAVREFVEYLINENSREKENC